jgi:CHAD domain-containing protein
MVEEERKYEVDAKFTVPDLGAALPSGGKVEAKPPKTLRATYYDTEDLRLARAGASLRHREGDDDPWTVKLPTAVPGVRHEISLPGGPSEVPPKLLDLVTAWTRGATVSPAVLVSTVRRAHELVDKDGTVLAELVDDAVSVHEGRQVRQKFREIEVERKEGKAKILDKVEEILLEAGAVAGDFTPKHVRALGSGAAEAPDWPRPADKPGADATAAEVVTAALRNDIARIIEHDPLVRLRATVGDNDTAVHQMRVGCRRLRSDLRTFGKLLDEEWADDLRAETGWLADALGGARDAEVLRARLRQTAAADPLAPLDTAALARMDAQLAARQDEALATLDVALGSDRYRALLDRLLSAATAPALSERAVEPAGDVLPRLVGKPWRRLVSGRDETPPAGALALDGPDETWHAVRIQGKRTRYAVEAVAGILGGDAAKLGKKLAAVQELLGEHQDAVIAADTWLAIAAAAPADHILAVTAGRLYERERASVRAARAAFGDAWAAASADKLTAWLR